MKKMNLTPNFKTLLTEISGHARRGRMFEIESAPKKPEDDENEPSPEAPPQENPAPSQEAPASPVPQADAAPAPEAPPQEAPTAQPPAENPNIGQSEVDQAEQEIDEPSFVRLNSDSGVKFLLNSILQPAIETNTLDSVAQDFVDKLKINNPSDLQTFKNETIQFRGVGGFNQLVQSMENFIGNE